MENDNNLDKKKQKSRRRKKDKDKDVQSVLESMACDPIAAMAVIANDPSVDVALRVKLLMELAQYVYPKRKGEFMAGVADEGVAVAETYEQRLRRIRALADEQGVPKKESGSAIEK
ncbi:MAG: hypothetical protein HQL04_05980 [Nitrospirae bacterium]|nr:hypothetical protein [Nitrospirota bacterium]